MLKNKINEWIERRKAILEGQIMGRYQVTLSIDGKVVASVPLLTMLQRGNIGCFDNASDKDFYAHDWKITVKEAA